jgi:preprotein translocase subunit SecF
VKSAIDFLKYRKYFLALSLVLIVGFSIGTALQGGFNFGIDFVGGVKITALFERKTDENTIRNALKKYGPTVQQIGAEDKNEYIISMKLPKGQDAEKLSENVKSDLKSNISHVTFGQVENVGPTIGNILKRDALKALVIALILMSIYLAFRFEVKYSVGTLLAVLHDITIALVFCGVTGIEINVPVVAAILTIFGYSVNDTIVIFDRIRENSHGTSKLTLLEVVNKSINQSLSRTLLTSLTTLFAISALYFLGGKVLNEFALVMLFGIFVGTYSSVYIASPILIVWERRTAK